MSPVRRFDDPFDWKASLEEAYDVFTQRDSGMAAFALSKALDDAAHMAALCRHEILRISPDEIPGNTLGDWYDFLTTLQEYMPNVFARRIELIGRDGGSRLRGQLHEIEAAALNSLMKVKYMDAEGTPRIGRTRALEELQVLHQALETAKETLDAKYMVRETARTPKGRQEHGIVQVPVHGHIAAGQPIIAIQSSDETLALPTELVGYGDLFIVVVDGDSMANSSIIDGDLAVVREQPSAENGEIVAARLDDEVIVKTLKRSGGHVWLHPENQIYDDILGDNAVIMGKVVAILRRM
jgi:SOS regulatory protein LexA